MYMRKILKIAKLEFSLLFYSPVAWLVLAVFTVQSGLAFFGHLQTFRFMIDMGYSHSNFTFRLFADDGDFYSYIVSYVYLYIPLLTMGLMSRELSSGSIKLLQSSPVKIWQIILGKYLAIVAYGLLLVCVLLIYICIAEIGIKDLDLGMVFSGLLSIALLIFTFAAIGLFMSCLTSYQVVAAISTIAIFACLQYVGTLWQGINFVRDITYYLSLAGRTATMIQGMITTRDLFYYLIIIITFLSFCAFRLKSQRELKPISVRVGRCALVVSAALLLIYITSRPVFTGYFDTTALKSLTLTKNSQDIAKKIHGDLKVTSYVNFLAKDYALLSPENRNGDLSTMEEFQRFIPGLDFKYVYYYNIPVDTNYAAYIDFSKADRSKGIDHIVNQMASITGADRDLFIPPAEINKLIDLKPEGYLSVRKLEYKGKSTYLRLYVDEPFPYPGEAEIAAAIKRLTTKASKAIFITGNHERRINDKAEKDYGFLSAEKPTPYALINEGFDVDTVNLNNQNIPEDVNIIVVGDPTAPFTQAELQKLAAYINNGGNMLIAGEPGRQQILNPFLQTLGVQLKPGVLVQSDKDMTPGYIKAQFSAQASALDANLKWLQSKLKFLQLKGSAGIDYSKTSNFQFEPILVSSSGSWNKQFTTNNFKHTAKSVSVETDFKPAGLQRIREVSVTRPGMNNPSPAPPPAPPVSDVFELAASDDLKFDSAAGDQKGVFPAMAALKRKINGREQRIIVSGDADFLSTGEITDEKRGKVYTSYELGLFRWLDNGEFPIDVSRLPGKDNDEKLSRTQLTVIAWTCQAGIPALIAIAGVVLLLARRRK